MKNNRLAFTLMLAVVIFPVNQQSLFGQITDQAPQRATLLHRKKTANTNNYVYATFSFEHGINGDAGKLATKNDWDLLFGNSPTEDIFDVTMVADDCSRIQDLGEFNWDNEFKIPVLPAYPEPTREPSVKAIPGHIYIVHTKDRNTDMYSLFRVEALSPGESVDITWKVIQSPEKNNAPLKTAEIHRK